MRSKLFKYLRTHDWLDSKVPFMLAVALFLCLYVETVSSTVWTYLELGAYFLYVSMFLAFSYVINDFTDMEVDKQAGKQKVMFSMTSRTIVASIILMVLLGVVPLFLIVENRIAYSAFTVFMYLAGAAYSVPILFRFKERGLIGLIECSVAQRCLPLIPLVFVFDYDWLYVSVFIALSFFNGLRYILVHQAIDYENDIKAGVKTFVSEGHNKYRRFIVFSFIIECILFIGILAKITLDHLFVIGVVLVYLMLEMIIAFVVVKLMQTDLFCTFTAVPLESLYNTVFPILLAVILTLRDYAFCGIIIFLFVLSFSNFKGKISFVSVYIKSKKRH